MELAIYITAGLALLNLVVLVVLFLMRPWERSITREMKRVKNELQEMIDGSQDVLQRDIHDEFWKTEQRINELKEKQGELKTDILRETRDHERQLNENLTRQANQTNSVLAETVKGLQESNEKKLEEMRATVDEKLTGTLNERLTDSFRQVTEQLESVYKSLGEMKSLAGDVNTLQRTLTNVKARGTWAEVQLEALLEQTLIPSQYEKNFSPKNNRDRVEFAIKIPSRDNEDEFVYIPLDSKFPQEDYLRILEAAEKADPEATEKAAKQLEYTVLSEGRDIRDKYISVPRTTDFAIMFLPTEGLYAEVLRRPGLAEKLQRDCHVMVCGPTTITAFLNTVSVGFRTLALDKQASEVWKLLSATKAQYDKFGELLNNIGKKLESATDELEKAKKRSGIIQKKLKNVEELESGEAEFFLLGTAAEPEEPDEE